MIADPHPEASPTRVRRGALCEVLVEIPDEPTTVIFGQVVWIEASSQPPNCELVEFTPVAGVFTARQAILDGTRDNIAALTTPAGVGLWIKLLTNR